MKHTSQWQKKQIKQIIYDFTISPFARHIAIEEMRRSLLGLVGEQEQELRDPRATWRLEDLIKAMRENKAYYEHHKDEKWIKVSKITGDS